MFIKPPSQCCDQKQKRERNETSFSQTVRCGINLCSGKINKQNFRGTRYLEHCFSKMYHVSGFKNCIDLLSYFLILLLEHNCFTVLYQFLLYIKVNQLCIYLHSLPLQPPSHPAIKFCGIYQKRNSYFHTSPCTWVFTAFIHNCQHRQANKIPFRC